MLKTIKLKTKLLMPLSLLVLIVLILTSGSISNQYITSKALLELKSSIELAIDISKLIHSVQKERGLSSGYLANNRKKFKEELEHQRVLTDQKYKLLIRYKDHINNKCIANSLKKSIEEKYELKRLREDVNQGKISAQKSIQLYSNLNEILLNTVVEISKVSKIPLITKNIIAYSNFLYYKENAGIKRAIGTAILSKNSYDKTLQIDFINIIAIENLYLKIFS